MSRVRPLFSAFGIEIEYMIVDRETLAVLPVADRLLAAAAGREGAADVDMGKLTWSNELVNHVLEMKVSQPAPSLSGLAATFAAHVAKADTLLAPFGGRLMPTGAHPLMDPPAETVLWPHEHGEIYRTFDAIFDCKGHGWSNLQSMHVNLPFRGDEEFGRLHAAIRVLLPIMPALAASTPILDGKFTGFLDARMDRYSHNADRVPSVMGAVIPEAVFSEQEYRDRILAPLYRDIAPMDPQGVLQDEFLNARGAIARFDRSTIEIRVLDTQECPAADLALAGVVVAALKGLVEERWSTFEEQKAWDTRELADILAMTTKNAGRTPVPPKYARLFGVYAPSNIPARVIWRRLALSSLPDMDFDPDWEKSLAVMVDQSSLARRILAAVDSDYRPRTIRQVYGRLCDCLAGNEPFHVGLTGAPYYL
ncbi:glutamate--cysteine ligase GCS2 [Solidesulfovibrio carbinoliphilus subsp. oakridgensis]|uniref:Glutamate--cysteine ligase GCS2 n=1 Tax=Solidesulfovibrio carbinoliphilus subsp. oakridgensis TaxID=694327 RepID=G7QDN0_9BACT|nr:glutamate-cysteine ligase family protein [Solidesulfovibrio carbinoliphilus]EHJ46536.1 glutamate--cysteine ligase GCS2 [Solidesulfovibrio carbinoliphilus subsp. oakridgensis]